MINTPHYPLAHLDTHQLKALRHRILGELCRKELSPTIRSILLMLLGCIDQHLATTQALRMKGPRYGRL